MNRLRQFMAGRHGIDELNIAILATALVISLIGSFLHPLVYFIMQTVSFILLGLAFFRMFSKNRARRTYENTRFLVIYNPIRDWFVLQKNRFVNRKTHVYFRCPNCKKSLRVPKGIGKVNITCPTCKEKFIRKV
ncbi:MAG: hypothetical protein IKR03_01980 [Clostridia bacterium]|nr:hypothetical protein [Clostridia bacterium]